jgi:hypothetical protein
MVWTERMLAALARGNDARQWHTLIDKVFAPKTLALALASATGYGCCRAASCASGTNAKAVAGNRTGIRMPGIAERGVVFLKYDHPRLSRESRGVKGASLTCGHSSTGEPDAGNPPVRF